MAQCICEKLGSFEALASRQFKRSALGAAQACGRENLPASDEAAPTAVEREIVERFQNGLAGLREYIKRALRQCAVKLEKQEPSPEEFNLRAPALEAVHEMRKLCGKTKDILIGKRKAERDEARELAYFKAENRLYRNAVYPKSRVLAGSFVLAILITESILNARVFAAADPLGLLGGWLFAVLVSVVNVLPSFLVGILVLRNLIHVRIFRRVVASIAFVAYLVFLVGYNFLVAHFRVALSIDPDNAAALAIPHLTEHPLDFSATVEAPILFFIGIVAALSALIDGYCLFDDRYPRYGATDRRYRATLASYEKTKDTFRRNIDRVAAKAKRTIHRHLKKINKKVKVGTNIIIKASLLFAEASTCASEGRGMCERTLHLWREENVRIRTTRPPRYFEVYSEINIEIDPPPVDLVVRRQRLASVLASKIEESTRVEAWLRERAEEQIQTLIQCAEEIESVGGTDDRPQGKAAPRLLGSNT